MLDSAGTGKTVVAMHGLSDSPKIDLQIRRFPTSDLTHINSFSIDTVYIFEADRINLELIIVPLTKPENGQPTYLRELQLMIYMEIKTT